MINQAVPDIVTSTLNVEIPVIDEETDNFKVAKVDCPGATGVLFLSQLTDRGPFAFAGFQFVGCILKVKVELPLFFM